MHPFPFSSSFFVGRFFIFFLFLFPSLPFHAAELTTTGSPQRPFRAGRPLGPQPPSSSTPSTEHAFGISHPRPAGLTLLRAELPAPRKHELGGDGVTLPTLRR
ncbi:hypothetical protein GGS23DRAFT_589474 [Durotheca rogersii]|uniref:uncharacterized protein n=1 Tax=Durotheca rogersii TaxID=419775 RepID=UPI00221F4E89|nr:uncharacterized protein GGS23DRAFT_589474 [Durotheca rogersii]KAI5855584.1 hypothetical protein GGS23DRAFT_589474 [Durotheca rogersii]